MRRGALARASLGRARPSVHGPEWAGISAALRDIAREAFDAPRVSVRCFPGGGGPAPGVCNVRTKVIGLDGELFGDVRSLGGALDREARGRIATGLGVLVHETGHAAHTDFRVRERAPIELDEIVSLLEEPRMEKRLCERVAVAPRFLAAAVREIKVPNLPDVGTVVPRSAAGRMALIVEGCRHTGTLAPGPRAQVGALIEAALGAEDAARIRELVDDVVCIADGDGEAMIAAAERYREIIGADEDAGPSEAELAAIAAAIAEALGEAQQASQKEIAERDPQGSGASASRELAARIVEQLARRAGREAAQAIARGSGGLLAGLASGQLPAVDSEGRPTPALRRAQRALVARLRKIRSMRIGRVPVAVPPGRFSGAGAMGAAAQRSVGRVVTAEPFRRRRAVKSTFWAPEVAVMIDTSGSMGSVASQLGPLVWVVGRACEELGGRVACGLFGNGVGLLFGGGRAPRSVPEIGAKGGTEHAGRALELCAETLRLADRRRPRLVIYVSDGHVGGAESAAEMVGQLAREGVGSVHVGIGSEPAPTLGCERVVAVPSAVACAELIGAEVELVLRGRAPQQS